MSNWHFYSLLTGELLGRTMSGPAADVAANCAEGEGVVQGVSDWRRQRVDLGTGELVELPPPALDLVALAADVRAERDRRLAACDWVVARSAERSEPIPAAWAAYRQQLRDLPQQAGFPESIAWPTPPTAP